MMVGGRRVLVVIAFIVTLIAIHLNHLSAITRPPRHIDHGGHFRHPLLSPPKTTAASSDERSTVQNPTSARPRPIILTLGEIIIENSPLRGLFLHKRPKTSSTSSSSSSVDKDDDDADRDHVFSSSDRFQRQSPVVRRRDYRLPSDPRYRITEHEPRDYNMKVGDLSYRFRNLLINGTLTLYRYNFTVNLINGTALRNEYDRGPPTGGHRIDRTVLDDRHGEGYL